MSTDDEATRLAAHAAQIQDLPLDELAYRFLEEIRKLQAEDGDCAHAHELLHDLEGELHWRRPDLEAESELSQRISQVADHYAEHHPEQAPVVEWVAQTAASQYFDKIQELANNDQAWNVELFDLGVQRKQFEAAAQEAKNQLREAVIRAKALERGSEYEISRDAGIDRSGTLRRWWNEEIQRRRMDTPDVWYEAELMDDEQAAMLALADVMVRDNDGRALEVRETSRVRLQRDQLDLLIKNPMPEAIEVHLVNESKTLEPVPMTITVGGTRCFLRRVGVLAPLSSNE